MSENSCSDNAIIREDKGISDVDSPYLKSNTDLLNEIEAMMSKQTADELDTDKIEEYLAILQERSPVMEDYDKKEQWDKLQNNHPMIFVVDEELIAPANSSERSKPNRKGLTFLHRAGVAVAVLFCFVITANAFGLNPVRVFLDWAEGTVQVYSNPSGKMELPPDISSEYRSLEEALALNGIDSFGCPNWVPKDNSLISVDVMKFDGIDQYSAIYKSERGELLIRFVRFADSAWAGVAERDDGGGYVYIKNNVEYYIVTNSTQVKAGWELGLNTCVISGQITEEELINIIDSI